jgi:nitrate reductase assembly molybdenum cofactor insertion protein NarJ
MAAQKKKQELFEALAGLYEYPSHGLYAKRIATFRKLVAEEYPALSKQLIPLAARTRGKPDGTVEEMYTRTFDINAICCLEIGWHIYGEEYARGSLMVRFRQELRRQKIKESAELPDHLTHVLQLIGRLEGEMADDLAGRYLLPAMGKMLDGMKGKESPYEALLVVTKKIIQKEHPDAKMIIPQVRRPEAPDSGNRLPVYGQQIEHGDGRSNGCGGGEC